MPSTLKPLGVVIGEYDVRYYQPKAAETFGYGDWLKWDSTGTVVIAAAAGAAVGNTDLVGRSMGSAADVLALSDTKVRRVPVLVPRMNTEFVFPYCSNAAASAPAAGTLALGDLDAPTDVDLIHATTGEWIVSSAVTTNPKFRVMGLWGEDELENTYGTAGFSYVRCRPIAALFAYSGA